MLSIINTKTFKTRVKYETDVMFFTPLLISVHAVMGRTNDVSFTLLSYLP